MYTTSVYLYLLSVGIRNVYLLQNLHDVVCTILLVLAACITRGGRGEVVGVRGTSPYPLTLILASILIRPMLPSLLLLGAQDLWFD